MVEDLAGWKIPLTPKLQGSHHTSLVHSGLCREAGILMEVTGFWT